MSSFRFLDLPDELRLKMYRFILPHGERIHIDPANVIFPIPYLVQDSFGTTSSLLRVCKKIHFEAMQFIYRYNTVNVIDTYRAANFLADLGGTACEYITRLECHVKEGLSDLGGIWATISNNTPQLTDLRLVFYHEVKHWSRTLAQLARYNYMVYPKDPDAGLHPPFTLDVELHSSIWAPRHLGTNYAGQFKSDWTRAERVGTVYSFKMPAGLRHITITASVHATAAESFAKCKNEGGGWEFRSVPDNDTELKKTMRFIME